MATRTRTKRTYNLSERTLRRVREIADRRTLASSQDAVVELAVDRLYDEIRGQEEAALWEAAADDPEFRAESAAIAGLYRDEESWPA